MLKAILALLPSALNPERVKTVVAWTITAFGAGLSGYFVAWGFGSQESWAQLLANPNIQSALVTVVVTLYPLIWRWLSKSEKNIVKTAETMPNVQAVVTKPTEEGEKLAAAITSPNVVAASDPKMVEVVAPTAGNK